MTESTDALASHVHRLAVLVGAGIAPASAWRHVMAAARPADAALAALVDDLDAGAPLGLAIDRVARDRDDGWRALAAAWSVATSSGAPLAPALSAFAEAVRDRAAAQRDIAVALAGPRATARIVLALPVVAIGLALLAGADILASLAHPIGIASILAGLALGVLARAWMARMLRAAAPPPPTVGLDLDLLAVAAGGGGSPEAARATVLRALVDQGLPAPSGAQAADDALSRLVALSRASGAPLGALARAEAAEARAAERARARRSAEELAVRLMLPLGVCVLPSFLLLGVVPMLVGLLSSTAGPTG
ncbi:MAG: type II secretion system F family protein [Microcella sp.]|uniref:type II secretion system F family protein n=1 Tax=Microcella sp. TaxID=1913979 RepID=UPI00271784F9|nr:type II secretion system F family protein [Microcella sp.]MDO8336770.1 type II secretion system F family protein [Microcella sp.]